MVAHCQYGKKCLEVPLDETGSWAVNLKNIEHAFSEKSAKSMRTDGNSAAFHYRW